MAKLYLAISLYEGQNKLCSDIYSDKVVEPKKLSLEETINQRKKEALKRSVLSVETSA